MVEMGRVLLAVLMFTAGIAHFRNPVFYERMLGFLPPSFSFLHVVAGVFEILGAAGLVVGPLKTEAARGIFLLLICVFPANVYVALRPELFPEASSAFWVLRIPLQFALLFWAKQYC